MPRYYLIRLATTPQDQLTPAERGLLDKMKKKTFMATPSIGSNGPQGLKRKPCHVLVKKGNEFLHQHRPQYPLLSSVTKRILFIVHHTPIKSGKQTNPLLVQTHSSVSPQVKNICMLFILHLRSL